MAGMGSKRIGDTLSRDTPDDDANEGPITNVITEASEDVIAKRKIVRPRRRVNQDNDETPAVPEPQPASSTPSSAPSIAAALPTSLSFSFSTAGSQASTSAAPLFGTPLTLPPIPSTASLTGAPLFNFGALGSSSAAASSAPAASSTPFSFSFTPLDSKSSTGTVSASAPASTAAPFSFNFSNTGFPQIQVGVQHAPKGEDEEEGGDDAEEEEEEVVPKIAAEGEENELTAFEERAKLFTQGEDTNWVPKPVGKIRVNVDKQTKKARMLFRVESAQKEALLNAYLFKQMSCQIQKDGKSVRFAVPAAVGKVAAYLLRFASKEQCDAFNSIVNSFKDSDAVTEDMLKKLAPETTPKKEKKAKQAADTSAEKAAEKPTEKPAEKPADKLAETKPPNISPFGSAGAPSALPALALPTLNKGESFAIGSNPFAFLGVPSSSAAASSTEEKVPPLSSFPASFMENKDAKGTLNLGVLAPKTDEKKDAVPAPVFNFGALSAPKTDEKKDAVSAPVFNFTLPNPDEKKDVVPVPVFNFGAVPLAVKKDDEKKDDSAKPFSFVFAPVDSKDTTSATTALSLPAMPAPSAPTSGFGFGAFSFNPNAQPAAPAAEEEGGEDDEAAEEEPEVPKPKAAGEEGEATVYAEKGKLFTKKEGDSKWDPVCVGEAKVNIEKADKHKGRILFRKDSTEKELCMNTYLFARMHCKVAADGKSVNLILVNADGTPVNWLVRFAKAEAATGFEEVVNTFKDAAKVTDDDVTKAEAAYNAANKIGLEKDAAAKPAKKEEKKEDKAAAEKKTESTVLPAFNLGPFGAPKTDEKDGASLSALPPLNFNTLPPAAEKKDDKPAAAAPAPSTPAFNFGIWGTTPKPDGKKDEKKDSALPASLSFTSMPAASSSSSGSAFGFAFGSAAPAAQSQPVASTLPAAPTSSSGGFSFGGFGVPPVAATASVFGKSKEEEKKAEGEEEGDEAEGDEEGEEEGEGEEGADDGEDDEGGDEGEEGEEGEEDDGEGDEEGDEGEGEEEDKAEELPEAPLAHKRSAKAEQTEEREEAASGRSKRTRSAVPEPPTSPTPAVPAPAPVQAAAKSSAASGSQPFNFRTALAAPSAAAIKPVVPASITAAPVSIPASPAPSTAGFLVPAALSSSSAASASSTSAASRPSSVLFGSFAAAPTVPAASSASTSSSSSALVAAGATRAAPALSDLSSPFSFGAPTRAATAAIASPATLWGGSAAIAPAASTSSSLASAFPAAATGFLFGPLSSTAAPTSSSSSEWKCACCETPNPATASTCSVCMVPRPAKPGAAAAPLPKLNAPLFPVTQAPAPSPIAGVRDAGVLAHTPVRKRKEEEPSSPVPASDDKKKARVELFSPVAQHEQWKCAACGTTNAVGIVCGNPSCLRMRLV